MTIIHSVYEYCCNTSTGWWLLDEYNNTRTNTYIQSHIIIHTSIYRTHLVWYYIKPHYTLITHIITVPTYTTNMSSHSFYSPFYNNNNIQIHTQSQHVKNFTIILEELKNNLNLNFFGAIGPLYSYVHLTHTYFM